MSPQTSPALVPQHAVQPAPRWALVLLCAAYVLPGILGRSPWRHPDMTAMGVMLSMAEGRSPWFAPALGLVPIDAAPLPHSLGALAIMVLSPWVEPSLAARIPFALMLVATLALTWYAAFYFARTEAAQPVAFAFGGEASHVDYARAIGDSAVLALMATLGLLQLGHETTPELAQLTCTAVLLWGMAAAPFRQRRARAAVLVSLPMLAASGAPSVAMALGAVTLAIASRSQYPEVRRAMPWIGAALLAAALLGTALSQWHWYGGSAWSAQQLFSTGRMLIWFLWPTWLLALWTLWRWRRHGLQRHIAVPLSIALTAVMASVVMNGSQRVLLLALPAMAVLAAFALPTLKRSTTAAIDWFSLFAFSAAALFFWLAYLSLLTGFPTQPARNIARLYVGFKPSFSLLALVLAALASVVWVLLVRWRTGRHRSAIWKSLVIPAGGVTLLWLMVMTLLMPLADYVRGMTPWVQRLTPHILTIVPSSVRIASGAPAVVVGACIAAPQVPLSYVAALEVHGGWRVDARPHSLDVPGADLGCRVGVVVTNDADRYKAPPPWRVAAVIQRPSDRLEQTLVLLRP